VPAWDTRFFPSVVTLMDRVARLSFTFKEPSSPGWITALATAILPGKEGFYADADVVRSGAGRMIEARGPALPH
jgi:hypothetical protein